ncbi:MAG: hypothetical protein ACOYOK_04765 [Pseudobdellovibrionaceae bacterium]
MSEDNSYDMSFYKLPHIPLPDDTPVNSLNLQSLPSDILKSSTVENLISQNEDLMARLKVAIRRLSILELENQKVAAESQKTQQSYTVLNDQILILKEKDQMWKQKIDRVEKSNTALSDKMEIYQQEVQRLETEIDRYKKYHEKVKVQVKPYIQELKKKLQEQYVELQEKNFLNQQKENLIESLREQVQNITQHAQKQIQIHEDRKIEMVDFYDNQIKSLQTELQELRPLPVALENKTVLLNKALERQDSLENEVVALLRSKEEAREMMQTELNRIQSNIKDLSRQNKKLGVEHADLQIRVLEDSETIAKLSGKNSELQEQLDSLRYMWSAKNDENEKLKNALQSLENLNLELSQKLNSLRSDAQTSL